MKCSAFSEKVPNLSHGLTMIILLTWTFYSCHIDFYLTLDIVQRFSRAGPRGRGREWATLGVHPLSWLLSNNRLEEVCRTLTKGTFSSRLTKTKDVPLVLLILFLFLPVFAQPVKYLLIIDHHKFQQKFTLYQLPPLHRMLFRYLLHNASNLWYFFTI